MLTLMSPQVEGYLGTVVQVSGSTIWNLQICLIFAVLGVALTLLRVVALSRYRAEREAGVFSSLGSLGNQLANTPFLLYNVLFSVSIALSVVFGLEAVRNIVGTSVLLIPLALASLGLLVAFVAFNIMTTRGRVTWRKGRVVREHQRLGHQDWILERHLSRLLKEKESSDPKQREVADRVLTELKTQEDKTGDSVRRLLDERTEMADSHPERRIPSLLWEFKFTLTVILLACATSVVMLSGISIGPWTAVDLFTALGPVFIAFLPLTWCVFCIEAMLASNRDRRLGAMS
jgi:hypothetical protein